MSGNRAKLVRAKVKEPEYLPDWATCCPQPMRIDGRDNEEMMVDLSRSTFREEKRCTACKADFPKYKAVWAITAYGREGWMPIEVLDLDEGANL